MLLYASFGFEVPLKAVSITVILFGIIFLINLVYNVFQVKEPRTKWPIALIGAAALVRSAGFSSSGISMLMFITAEEYHRIEGVSAELSEGRSLVHVVKGELPGDTLDFGGYSLSIRGLLDKMKTIEEFSHLKNSMLAQNHLPPVQRVVWNKPYKGLKP